MPRISTIFNFVLCFTGFAAIISCAASKDFQRSAVIEPGAETSIAGLPQPELAPYMGDLQRFSQKAGYALAAKNDVLALFYIEELEETLKEILMIPEHDGMPIADPARIILKPLIGAFKYAVQQKEWTTSADAYAAFIEGCNRCHAATEHEFIRIRRSDLTPSANPYDQDFSKQ